MNDIQILTLALTVVVPFFGVMLGVLINNSRLGDVNNRIGDVKEFLNDRIDSSAAGVRAEMRTQNAELLTLIERHHSELMAKMIDMDNRMVRLESQRLVQ